MFGDYQDSNNTEGTSSHQEKSPWRLIYHQLYLLYPSSLAIGVPYVFDAINFINQYIL